MTTLFRSEETCIVCKKKSHHNLVCTTTAFGSRDLDLRPPSMERENIGYLVQRCPECGYCASELNPESVEEMGWAEKNDFIFKVSNVVNSDEYKIQLNHADYSELANSFLCKALVEIKTEELIEAYWSTANAAWACDDDLNQDSAIACRTKALKIIDKIHENDQKVLEEDDDEILQIDLLRRSKQFDKAKTLIDKFRPETSNEIILKILDFHEELIKKGDDSCYTIGGATGEGF